jgi:hypothetical protein
MIMGFVTAGYDGTVDEVQFAKLLRRYSVVGAEDFKATTQAGDRIVAISDGTALGPGTVDIATAIPNIQFAAAAANTTRWDLVALRRDWQPPGGATSVVIIQGGSTAAYPSVGTASTAWNRRPGIIDDQPLYLQEINGTLLGTRVDLRVWAANGGLYAKDALVRPYLEEVGTEIRVGDAVWTYKLGDNDSPGWVKSNPARGRIRGSAGTPGWESGNLQIVTNQYGVGFIDFEEPFPNNLRTLNVNDASAIPTSGAENIGVVCKSRLDLSSRAQGQFVAYGPSGALAGKTLYVSYIATGD